MDKPMVRRKIVSICAGRSLSMGQINEQAPEFLRSVVEREVKYLCGRGALKHNGTHGNGRRYGR